MKVRPRSPPRQTTRLTRMRYKVIHDSVGPREIVCIAVETTSEVANDRKSSLHQLTIFSWWRSREFNPRLI